MLFSETEDPAARSDPASRPDRLRAVPMLRMGLFGFASGLPLLLTFSTVQQWLSESHVSLKAIGAAAFFGMPYLLKFLWAPVLDRMPPAIFRRMGRRRGWMLPVQAALAASILALSWCDPSRGLWPVAITALCLAFFSATQDVLIDAWRIESFAPRFQAAALGAYSWGYRIAMLCSGGGAIWLATRIGWHGSLLCMALLSLSGPVAALWSPEPVVPVSAVPRDWRDALRQRVVLPFRDLLGRPAVGAVIAFVLVANLGTQLADSMAYPFYHRLGLSPAAVAQANLLPALAAALAGAAASGVLVARLGLGRTLILTACLQMASIGLYVAMARTGASVPLLFAKVVIEGFAEVMAATTFGTYLSRLCSLRYTATQFALLSSLAPVAWRTLGGTSGVLAEALGWTRYFGLTMLCCLPGIAIMSWLLSRYPGGLPPAVPEPRPQA
ncbi:AmpG family muropeptide MFS transporter [Rhizosaccharibacter radicis]|uniref:MFS transporter n=1 Tax=Rhizosaccharibacter radicis TaxID=2782605 RepID=A0ABT1W1I5_9PROT|nr:MFS transporter [Acetobacteraceae bacterium KSS12]